jgi:hypothetical protein
VVEAAGAGAVSPGPRQRGADTCPHREWGYDDQGNHWCLGCRRWHDFPHEPGQDPADCHEADVVRPGPAARLICPRQHRGWDTPLPLDRILTGPDAGGYDCPGIAPDGSACGYRIGPPVYADAETRAEDAMFEVPLSRLNQLRDELAGLRAAAIAVLDAPDMDALTAAMGRLRAAVGHD